jgi:hypothetical protein
VDQAQLELAVEGLQRLGAPGAVRAAEHLQAAVDIVRDQPNRWSEQLCYSLREALNEIPLLFGQTRRGEPLGPRVSQFLDEVNDLMAVANPPDVLRVKRLIDEFQETLEDADRVRRFRIAQAMLIQAGAQSSSPEVDRFAADWTDVVGRVNSILHGDVHSPDDALTLLDRAVPLIASMVGAMSARLEEVDRLAELESPADDDVRQLIHLAADERLAWYFFGKAGSGAWLGPLDEAGFFNAPIRGGWYQAAFLVRVCLHDPPRTRDILRRVAADPHPAAAATVVEVVAHLGPADTPYAIRAISEAQFADPFRVARALNALVEGWAEVGATETLPGLADVALEPRLTDGFPRVAGKFDEYEFRRLVELFVSRIDCAHVGQLAQVLGFKLKRVMEISGSAGRFLSMGRDLVDEDGSDEQDVGQALLSGVRDVLRRMRACGANLEDRRAVLEPFDNEVSVRIWAGHLADEALT